jgi:hypothetical protein
MRHTAAALFFAASLGAADLAWLASSGGLVTRDKEGQITGLDLRSSWVTDSDLAEVARLPRLAHWTLP